MSGARGAGGVECEAVTGGLRRRNTTGKDRRATDAPDTLTLRGKELRVSVASFSSVPFSLSLGAEGRHSSETLEWLQAAAMC